jgi:hypothetical protein
MQIECRIARFLHDKDSRARGTKRHGAQRVRSIQERIQCTLVVRRNQKTIERIIFRFILEFAFIRVSGFGRVCDGRDSEVGWEGWMVGEGREKVGVLS